MKENGPRRIVEVTLRQRVGGRGEKGQREEGGMYDIGKKVPHGKNPGGGIW